MSVISQSGRMIQMPREMGTDNIRAVKADNCWGERFLGLNIYVKGKQKKPEDRESVIYRGI